MPTNHSNDDLMSINAKLIDINLQSKGQSQVNSLKEFTQLARLLTDTHTCILTFVNLDESKVTKVACSSENQEFEEFLEKKREIELKTADKKIGISYELAANGTSYETNTLQKNGGGVASPEVSKKFGLHSFYCYPLKTNNSLRGYLNFFSTKEIPFSEQIKYFIGIVSKFAEINVLQNEVWEKLNEESKKLKNFIIDNKSIMENKSIIAKISHELRSPVSGILGNIDRLKAHHRNWEDRFIDIKLEDIELDCEILKHNILELEYFLGRPFRKVQIGGEPIFVIKDIVQKIIKQLKPTIEDEGFYFDIDSCIDKNDLEKIRIYTDKIKLGQVFYNLVVNSIRYANKYSKAFRLKVIVDNESDKDYFIIKFQDWGIGIKEEYKDKIFDDYFRAPEAVKQFVSGTGLGLTISRTILRNDLKGDLILANRFNPTEFNVKIPKRYEKKPH